MATLADRRFEMTLRNRVLFGVGSIEALPEVVALGRRLAGVRRHRPGRPAIRGHRDGPGRAPGLGRGRRRVRRGRTEPGRLDRRARRGRPARLRAGRHGRRPGRRRLRDGHRQGPGPARGQSDAGLGARVRRSGPGARAGRSSRSRRPPGPGPRRTASASSPTRPPGARATSAIPSLLPKATILDPGLTVGLPPAVTAATGVDAMTHSLESLLSANPNPFAEAVAIGVIRTVERWLRRAVADGTDLEARSQMLMASHLAGVGQASGTGVGLVHALGHAIGTRGRVAHGTALAAVLPEVLRFYLGTRDRELALVWDRDRRRLDGRDRGDGRRRDRGRHRQAAARRRPAPDPALARPGRRRLDRPDRRRRPRRRRDPQLAATPDRRRSARDPGVGRGLTRAQPASMSGFTSPTKRSSVSTSYGAGCSEMTVVNPRST